MSNEEILDSMPIADLVRALVKREYVSNLVTSERIRVIMLPKIICTKEVINNE